ncbi:hypothetical protein RSal33209_2167 [Renibacterium salmoninarum ATCC 33209]|uniref:Uncharacterized protein n=1 Tax=Renibacterium salmoninarum (strain ATCC 33209 / DSM 20767 / JCM 11484 / NBRC 15589 / NCIMB 2235) TaxID=288705 RepID=A9WSW1_RENSM|nr:hypothetical protein [Renibacterium salmoninarum]ABY23899.1 hypothetical protein RSal33209_2167 [Renibacterium salmoninarum ATCC 33209]
MPQAPTPAVWRVAIFTQTTPIKKGWQVMYGLQLGPSHPALSGRVREEALEQLI